MATVIGSYRIRWARVTILGHRFTHRERRCIAERRYRFFGWWPLSCAEWRTSEAKAETDIERDREMRMPLPRTRPVA
jgi:hypothetical protein